MPKLILSRQKLSEEVGVLNLFRCCDIVIWPLGRVSSLSPLGARLGGATPLTPYISVAAALIRVRVLLRFILSRTVVAVHRFVKPQLVRLIIDLQSHFI